MSLHHAFQSSLGGHLARDSVAPETVAAPTTERTLSLPRLAPMRLLEVGVALLAMTTAVLIGIGR